MLVIATLLTWIAFNNQSVLEMNNKDIKAPPTDTSSHWRCSVRKVFLEILQNSQENTCARASF